MEHTLSKREEQHRSAEGGFTENEMRTDWARSHVVEAHARQLEHERLPDAHDTLDKMVYQAGRIRSEHPAAASLLENGAAKLEQLGDKLREEKREHSACIRTLNLAQNEIDAMKRSISELSAENASLRLHIDTLSGGAIL